MDLLILDLIVAIQHVYKLKKSKHSLSHRDKESPLWDYHFPITYENHTKCSILKYRIVWYDTISYHIINTILYRVICTISYRIILYNIVLWYNTIIYHDRILYHMIGQCIIWYDIVLWLDTILSYDMNRKGIMIWCFIIYLTIYQLIHTISFLILQLYHFMIQIWNNITIHDSTSYHKYMIQYTIILYNIVASFHINMIQYRIISFDAILY